jgi:hypothetical protein
MVAVAVLAVAQVKFTPATMLPRYFAVAVNVVRPPTRVVALDGEISI